APLEHSACLGELERDLDRRTRPSPDHGVGRGSVQGRACADPGQAFLDRAVRYRPSASERATRCPPQPTRLRSSQISAPLTGTPSNVTWPITSKPRGSV